MNEQMTLQDVLGPHDYSARFTELADVAGLLSDELEHQRERTEVAFGILGLGMVTSLDSPPGPIEEIAEDLAFDMKTLADVQNSINWVMGDLISKSGKSIGRMRAYNIAAESLGKSPRWAMILCRVAECFPNDRFAQVDWYMYRVCTETRNPIVALITALRENLTPKSLKTRMQQSEKS